MISCTSRRQKLVTPSPLQHGLPMPQHPLPPIPRDAGPNVKVPIGGCPSERQAGPSRIVDLRLVETDDSMQRTSARSNSKIASAQSLGDRHFYPRSSFSSLTNASSFHGSYVQKEPSKVESADSQCIVDFINFEQLDHGCKSSDKSSLPSSTMSITARPFKVYCSSRPTLSITIDASSHEAIYRLYPIEAELGVSGVIDAMPQPDTSSTAVLPRRKRTTKVSCAPTKKTIVKQSSSVTALQRRNDSVVAVMKSKSEQDMWQQPFYIPGRISVEANTPNRLSSTLTPLDLLQEGTESQLRNNTEESMLDETAEFFESFGDGFRFDALNTGLDKFWTDFPLNQSRPSFAMSNSTRCSSLESETASHEPSGDHNLPEETSSFNGKSASCSDRDSEDGEKPRNPHIPSPQDLELSKALPYASGLPLSPLPALPTTSPVNDSRKLKPGGRPGAGASHPRISLRRLLHSAGNII
jgi:hypothetical protein